MRLNLWSRIFSIPLSFTQKKNKSFLMAFGNINLPGITFVEWGTTGFLDSVVLGAELYLCVLYKVFKN